MEQVAEYRLVALLGEGGMGRVQLARTASGRLVAVKTVHEHLAADPRFRERFRREILAARAVAGPFTAAVLDADPDAVRPWLATEFCAGPTLAETADALGPLGAGPLAALGAALASIHRGAGPPRPEAVERGAHPGGPKVLDFGIARRAADETLTAGGEVIGSPGFIAPELLAADVEPTPAADVFALAALLARPATGRSPNGSGPVHQVLYRTVRGEAGLDGVPTSEWRAFLAACLTGDPTARPTVADVLRRCSERSAAADGAWAVSGRIRWTYEGFEGPVAALAAAPEAGCYALLSTEGALHFVRARDGGRLATATLKGGASAGSSALAAVGSTVLPATGGRVHAYAPATGAPLWSVRTVGLDTSWPAVTGGGRAPVTAGGALLHWARAGQLRCVDLRSGEERWTARLDGVAQVPPVAVGGTVYAATGEVCRALDLNRGAAQRSWTVADIRDLAADASGWYARLGTATVRAYNHTAAGPAAS